jgi:hypothetical protein
VKPRTTRTTVKPRQRHPLKVLEQIQEERYARVRLELQWAGTPDVVREELRALLVPEEGKPGRLELPEDVGSLAATLLPSLNVRTALWLPDRLLWHARYALRGHDQSREYALSVTSLTLLDSRGSHAR